MLHFIRQKLIHKKWMVIALLTGNILLGAIMISNPLYQGAALQKNLDTAINNFVTDTGKNPAVLSFDTASKDFNGKKEELMYDTAKGVAEKTNLKEDEFITCIRTSKVRGKFKRTAGSKTTTKTLRLAMMSDFSEHIKILAGESYDKLLSEGKIPVIASRQTLNKTKLVLGDEIAFDTFKGVGGYKLPVFCIVGVYTYSDSDDSYWVKSPSDYTMDLFMPEDIFKQMFLDNQNRTLTLNYYTVLDYTGITGINADEVYKKTKAIGQKIEDERGLHYAAPAYMDILKSYRTNARKVKATLYILQVPVFALLLAFIFMISMQMLELEKNEIALLKSRGASKKQIFMIYLMQSLILAVISAWIAFPLAFLLCQILGSTNGFLEFIGRKALHITIRGSVFIYMAAAIVIEIGCMVLPVIRDADLTIVLVKHKNKNSTFILKRVFFDVILLIISLYGCYSFADRKDALVGQMLEGEALDPFLFLCSSVFIISAALVSLRIVPYLVKLIYRIGMKKWSPAIFASFLQIIRSRGRQSFMMVFLMLTVALGIYNATVARTILTNSESNIRYKSGTDLILKEQWLDNEAVIDSDVEEITYFEPDFSAYESMKGVKAASRVYRDDDMRVRDDDDDEADQVETTLLGIHTKSFGEVCENFDPALLPAHLNEYLNAMAMHRDALICSMNFHTDMGLELGDTISCKDEDNKPMKGRIYAFVDYFPGYVDTFKELGETGKIIEKKRYLIVANLAYVQQNYGLKPYEVWIHTDGSTAPIYDYVESEGLKLTKFEDTAQKLVSIRTDAFFQGTNGILTMSFIVILILCSVGFLIYWILSIRQRELLFGVFRAMGMASSQVIKMLACEQMFSSGISILVGTGLGVAASVLFVPLVQIFYAETDQVVPLKVVTLPLDMVRLFAVIAVVIMICMVVLSRLIKRIHIGEALKLGED